MSLELNDSFHIIIRSGCLVNVVSKVKEKRAVRKVFIKCESFGGCKKLSVCVPVHYYNVLFPNNDTYKQFIRFSYLSPMRAARV